MSEPIVDAAVVDVAVVGAGIVGAACAYELAKAGQKVVVLEREASPASCSTGLSAAGVRVQWSEPVNVALSLHGITVYRDFAARLGVDSGYRPVGYLFLVPDEQWDRHLAAVEVQRSFGAPVEVIDLASANARFLPFDPVGLAGATFGPIDGIIDPHSVTLAYLGRAREHGADLHLASEVTRIDHGHDGWTLTVADGRGTRTGNGTGSGRLTRTVTATTVVNAAGAWAGQLAALAGRELPVVPVRRMIWMTGPRAGRPTSPLTVDVASGFYHRGEGERLLMGRSNPDEPAGFTTGMDWPYLDVTMPLALRRYPWLAEESLDTAASWFGFYAVTPDHNAIIGCDPEVATWVNAAGFSGHGIQQAPAVARAVREEIVDGRATTIDIDPLRLERFRSGSWCREGHAV